MSTYSYFYHRKVRFFKLETLSTFFLCLGVNKVIDCIVSKRTFILLRKETDLLGFSKEVVLVKIVVSIGILPEFGCPY